MYQKKNPPSLLKSLLFLLILLILISWVFYLPYKVVRDNTISSLNAQQSLLAKQAADGIEKFFKSYEKLLRHLARNESIIQLDDSGKELLERFLHDNKDNVDAISRVDSSGRILHTLPFCETAIGLDVSGQDHNRLIIDSHEPVVSSVFKAVQGYDTVAFAVPVFAQGEYAGSLSILIPFTVVAEEYLATIIVGENGYPWLLSREGVELYCPMPGHVGRTVFETSSAFPSVIDMAKKMMTGQAGQAIYSYDRLMGETKEKNLKHAAYHPVNLPQNLWSIVVATPEKQALAAIQGFGRWWMTIFGSLVVGALGYSFYLFRSSQKFEEQRKREEAEKKLLESQKLFSRFINEAHLPIAMVNINGTVEFLNEKCVEIYGYTLTDIPTMDAWFDKAYPEPGLKRAIAKSWQQRLAAARTEKCALPVEERAIVCKDGSVKDVEFAYTFVDDRLIITLNDKTEQNQLEWEKKQLVHKKAKARKMEAMGLLAGGVAHDLNNILSGVVSYPELLLLQLPEDSEMRPAMQIIFDSGKQAAAVVADLLTVARGVATVMKTENLNTLIMDYMKSQEYRATVANHQDVSYVRELAADLGNISCSAVHVKKCLMNLITNGAEAIDGAGQVIISTRNEFVDPAQAGKLDLQAGEYAVLSVGDNGGGIAELDKEHIFEPFYTKKQMGRSGTGLGLAVVWNTMQDHNGAVMVTSNDQGTLFELYFPVCHEELTSKEEKKDLALLRGHGEKILVVDDESCQRDIACKFLAHLNYECHAVASGEEALDYLAKHPVDLVVLDMIMGPGMDGCRTYAALVDRNPHQKAIIASGFSETDNVTEAQRLGAGDFIKKPYSMAQLGRAVQQELAR